VLNVSLPREEVDPRPQPADARAAGLRAFDEGLAQFKAGRYTTALLNVEGALKEMPNDPVVHEVRALCLFALGRYTDAAATLNALLAAAPGMDWTSLSRLYGDVEDYTQQLRKLETHVRLNRDDAAAAFVLGYHYLVIGEDAAAERAFQEVVRVQPKDATAKRLLASVAAEKTPPPAANDPANPPPATDLVGQWQSKSDDATIDLVIDEESNFIWKAKQKDKPAVEIRGKALATAKTLVLEGEKAGTMVGQVTAEGENRFRFSLAGAPADAALTFQRTR
jgi:tetratricopeptide (TPR) repeat protein